MITLYDLAAATTYIQAWLAEDNQWIFDSLPAEIPLLQGQGSLGPAVSVRAHSEDRRFARYDSASRTAIVRVGSLTWTVRDQAAADSMRDAWRHIADQAPISLQRGDDLVEVDQHGVVVLCLPLPAGGLGGVQQFPGEFRSPPRFDEGGL